MAFIVKAKVPKGQDLNTTANRLRPRGFNPELEYQCLETITRNTGASTPGFFLVLLNDENEFRIEDSAEWVYVKKLGRPKKSTDDNGDDE